MAVDTEAVIGQFLTSHGFRANMSGYHYVKDSIMYIIQNNRCISSNKVIFAEIAKKNNTESYNIERCIRTLIRSVGDKIFEMHLFLRRPTVREFILKCAEQITSQNIVMDYTPTSIYDILAQ